MEENVIRKRLGSGPLKGSGVKTKLEAIAIDDDMTIGAMKDEIVRRLAVERSKAEISTAKTSQSGSDVKNVREDVREEEGMKIKPVMEDKDIIKTPVKKRGADGELVLAYLSSPERSSSRLRPRKEVPSFRMVDLDENDDDRIVGKRVKLYWPESRKWFTGHIKAFDGVKRLHSILYDDGDKEELDLRSERFLLEIMPTEGFNFIVESFYKKKAGGLNSDVTGTITSAEGIFKVGDTEEEARSPESKKVRKRGSSKSLRKGTKLKENFAVKRDLDVIPDNVAEVITDKIHFAEEPDELNFGIDSDNSKSLAEIAAQLRPSSEVKKMCSDNDDTEGSEKTESGDPILLKSFVSLKKRKKGATNVKSSKLISRKEIDDVETLDEDMKVDLHHDDELKKIISHADINVEEAVILNHQKENDKTDRAFETDGEIKSGVPRETLATTTDFVVEDAKISGEDEETLAKAENITALENAVMSLILRSHSMTGKMESLPPNIEASVHAKKVDEVISKETSAQGSRDADAVKNHNERKLVSKAAGVESFNVSADLQSTIPENPDEKNAEMQQEKLKVDDIKEK